MPTASKDVTIKVMNTEFRIGDVLEVTPKLDLDAPSGFQQFNTSKLLMKGIAEVHSPVFDENLGMWDTGFETLHESNRQIPTSEKEVRVRSFVNNIQRPYEKRFRKDLSATNDDFWGTYTFEVHTGKSFDTNNEKELLELFFAIKDGVVCEVKETDYYLKKAKYNITNKKEVQSLEDKKQDTKFEAMGTLKALLDSFKPNKEESIYTILEWINVSNVRGADKDTIKKAVLKFLDNSTKGYDNSRRFLDAYRMLQDPAKKEIMENFEVLNKLLQKRKIEYRKRQYFIDGLLLGNNLKEAAEKLNNEKELKDAVDKSYSAII